MIQAERQPGLLSACYVLNQRGIRLIINFFPAKTRTDHRVIDPGCFYFLPINRTLVLRYINPAEPNRHLEHSGFHCACTVFDIYIHFVPARSIGPPGIAGTAAVVF